MPLEQTSKDIKILVNEVQRIRRDLVTSLPYPIQQQIEHELEDFGYDLIIHHGLRRHEVGYLTTCMNNAKKRFIGNLGKRLQRYKHIAEEFYYDPGSDSDDGNTTLDKLYMSTAGLSQHDKEFAYVMVVMIVRGSTAPIKDTAAEIGVSRMTVNKFLRRWKAAYAKEVNRQVPEVRSLNHLQKLLRWRAGK